jgi:hypothetical protein
MSKLVHSTSFFPGDKSDWNQQVIVYFCDTWQGEPTETEEMKPKWYDLTSIPYDSMWQDDKYWLPEAIAGKFVEAEFHFDDSDGVLKQQVNTKQLV